jgi:hypothetical protein
MNFLFYYIPMAICHPHRSLIETQEIFVKWRNAILDKVVNILVNFEPLPDVENGLAALMIIPLFGLAAYINFAL